ncbi:MAG: Ig-like domain-containing protein [Myxococcaceae bacterium]
MEHDVEYEPRHRCRSWTATLLLLMVLGSACQGSGAGGQPDGGGNPGPGIIRVEITPGSVLLGAAGQTHALSARAFDAQNREVAATFAWTSSHPDQVSVDASGKLTGKAIGSAQITAETAGVTSAAATILVAETAPGAVLVSDAQVVSVGPVTFTPADGPGVGTQYEVRLKGVSPAPSPGTILLASESAQVAGKVVSTRDESGTLVATLELRPLYEVLGRYRIDWDLDVAPFGSDVLAPPGAQADPGTRSAALGTRSPADTALQQFNTVNCDGTVDAKLATKKVSLGPTSSLHWVVQETRDDPNQAPSHVKHALVGQFALVGTVEIGFNPQVSVDATCAFTLPPIRIAAFGAASLLVMPAIRLGVGLDLHAALQAASASVGLTGKVGFQAEIGWECGPGPCQGLATLSEIDDVKPKLQAPSTHGIQVDLSARLYAFAGLDLAILGGLAGYFGIAEAQIGPKQSASLASEDDQAQLPGSSSSYKLDLVGSIAPGAGLKAAIKKVIDDSAVSVDLTFQRELSLSRSPRGTMSVSKAQAAVGDPVKFTVDIDPDTASYLGIGYNIVSIQFYRVKLGDPEFTVFQDLEIVPSASNQTHFEKSWTPKSSDIGMYQYAAFVHTEVHDTGLLPLLEVADDTRKQVEVQGICAPSALAARSAGSVVQQQQSGSCQVNGTVHGTTVSDFPGATHYEYTRDTNVTFTQQVSLPFQLTFVPHGTCTMSYSGSGGNCTRSATSVSCDFANDYTQPLTIDIDNSTDPPTYRYYGEIFANVVVHVTETCGTSTSVYDLATNARLLEIPDDDKQLVGPDGSIRGTRSEVQTPPGGTITDTWTWDLKLEIAPPAGP